MADNAGDLEGEPFGTIEFHVLHSNRRVEIVPFDIGLKSPLIGGHKLDLAEGLNVEGQEQAWTYNDIILQDDKSLWDYGINGCETIVITVTVS